MNPLVKRARVGSRTRGCDASHRRSEGEPVTEHIVRRPISEAAERAGFEAKERPISRLAPEAPEN
jgi:hypothetical protein